MEFILDAAIVLFILAGSMTLLVLADMVVVFFLALFHKLRKHDKRGVFVIMKDYERF